MVAGVFFCSATIDQIAELTATATVTTVAISFSEKGINNLSYTSSIEIEFGHPIHLLIATFYYIELESRILITFRDNKYAIFAAK